MALWGTWFCMAVNLLACISIISFKDRINNPVVTARGSFSPKAAAYD